METLLTDDHCTAPVRGPSSAAAASTLSSSASTEQCRQALLPTSADPLLSFMVPTAPSSARAAVPSKKWAGRRHPRPSSSSSVATADAAAKVSAMAASEQAYYAAKLEMDKKEHEVRMRILLLQEEFEVKRLKKMEEWLFVRFQIGKEGGVLVRRVWAICLINVCLIFILWQCEGTSTYNILPQ